MSIEIRSRTGVPHVEKIVKLEWCLTGHIDRKTSHGCQTGFYNKVLKISKRNVERTANGGWII